MFVSNTNDAPKEEIKTTSPFLKKGEQNETLKKAKSRYGLNGSTIRSKISKEDSAAIDLHLKSKKKVIKTFKPFVVSSGSPKLETPKVVPPSTMFYDRDSDLIDDMFGTSFKPKVTLKKITYEVKNVTKRKPIGRVDKDVDILKVPDVPKAKLGYQIDMSLPKTYDGLQIMSAIEYLNSIEFFTVNKEVLEVVDKVLKEKNLLEGYKFSPEGIPFVKKQLCTKCVRRILSDIDEKEDTIETAHRIKKIVTKTETSQVVYELCSVHSHLSVKKQQLDKAFKTLNKVRGTRAMLHEDGIVQWLEDLLPILTDYFAVSNDVRSHLLATHFVFKLFELPIPVKLFRKYIELFNLVSSTRVLITLNALHHIRKNKGDEGLSSAFRNSFELNTNVVISTHKGKIDIRQYDDYANAFNDFQSVTVWHEKPQDEYIIDQSDFPTMAEAAILDMNNKKDVDKFHIKLYVSESFSKYAERYFKGGLSEQSKYVYRPKTFWTRSGTAILPGRFPKLPTGRFSAIEFINSKEFSHICSLMGFDCITRCNERNRKKVYKYNKSFVRQLLMRKQDLMAGGGVHYFNASNEHFRQKRTINYSVPSVISSTAFSTYRILEVPGDGNCFFHSLQKLNINYSRQQIFEFDQSNLKTAILQKNESADKSYVTIDDWVEKINEMFVADKIERSLGVVFILGNIMVLPSKNCTDIMYYDPYLQHVTPVAIPGTTLGIDEKEFDLIGNRKNVRIESLMKSATLFNEWKIYIDQNKDNIISKTNGSVTTYSWRDRSNKKELIEFNKNMRGFIDRESDLDQPLCRDMQPQFNPRIIMLPVTKDENLDTSTIPDPPIKNDPNDSESESSDDGEVGVADIDLYVLTQQMVSTFNKPTYLPNYSRKCKELDSENEKKKNDLTSYLENPSLKTIKSLNHSDFKSFSLYLGFDPTKFEKFIIEIDYKNGVDIPFEYMSELLIQNKLHNTISIAHDKYGNVYLEKYHEQIGPLVSRFQSTMSNPSEIGNVELECEDLEHMHTFQVDNLMTFSTVLNDQLVKIVGAIGFDLIQDVMKVNLNDFNQQFSFVVSRGDETLSEFSKLLDSMSNNTFSKASFSNFLKPENCPRISTYKTDLWVPLPDDELKHFIRNYIDTSLDISVDKADEEAEMNHYEGYGLMSTLLPFLTFFREATTKESCDKIQKITIPIEKLLSGEELKLVQDEVKELNVDWFLLHEVSEDPEVIKCIQKALDLCIKKKRSYKTFIITTFKQLLDSILTNRTILRTLFYLYCKMFSPVLKNVTKTHKFSYELLCQILLAPNITNKLDLVTDDKALRLKIRNVVTSSHKLALDKFEDLGAHITDNTIELSIMVLKYLKRQSPESEIILKGKSLIKAKAGGGDTDKKTLVYGYDVRDLNAIKFIDYESPTRTEIVCQGFTPLDSFRLPVGILVENGISITNPRPHLMSDANIIMAVSMRAGKEVQEMSYGVAQTYKFVSTMLAYEMQPMRPEDMLTFEEWLSASPYTIEEKLRIATVWADYQEIQDDYKKAKLFIKDEAYDEIKYPRCIFAAADIIKCIEGPLVKSLEAKLFKTFGDHVKGCSTKEKLDRIRSGIKGDGDGFCSMDWSKFESMMTNGVLSYGEYNFYRIVFRDLGLAWKVFEVMFRRCERRHFRNFDKTVEATFDSSRESGESATATNNYLQNKITSLVALMNIVEKLFFKPHKMIDPNNFAPSVKVWDKTKEIYDKSEFIYEGDDSWARIAQVIIDQFEHTFHLMGLQVTISKGENMHNVEFCSANFSKYGMLKDPFRVILRYGYLNNKYLYSTKGAINDLMFAKAECMLFDFPACPIITSFLRYNQRIFPKTKHYERRLKSYLKILNYYDRERHLIANTAVREGNGDSYICPEMRLIFEEVYGWSVEEQIEIERVWDEAETVVSPHSSLIDRYPKDSYFYSMLYTRSTDVIRQDLEWHFPCDTSGFLATGFNKLRQGFNIKMIQPEQAANVIQKGELLLYHSLH